MQPAKSIKIGFRELRGNFWAPAIIPRNFNASRKLEKTEIDRYLRVDPNINDMGQGRVRCTVNVFLMAERRPK